jgi:hypothetical protein
MPTIAYEFEEIQRRPVRPIPQKTLPAGVRIGSGVALATSGGLGRWKDNPHHWQTLILLFPLLHNPDQRGYRKRVSMVLIKRTVDEMRSMFSGYTLSRARGWYWDEKKGIGVSDELIRCEIDGVFTGNELHTLHAWRKKLLRRFKQDYIYMRLVVSGTAL